MVLFHYMICPNCSKHILKNRAECHFPYCKIHFGRLACKLPSLEINLDKLFCSGGQRRRTITVGLHFLPQGNFQNNSQVKPRLSCPGYCLFVRKLSFSTFITVDAWTHKDRVGARCGSHGKDDQSLYNWPQSVFSMASPRKRHKFAHKFGQNRRASLTEIGRAITFEIWAISNRNYSDVNFDQSFYINQICVAWYYVLYRGFIEATEVWVKTIRSYCFPCRGRKYDQFGIHKFSNKLENKSFCFPQSENYICILAWL